MPLQIDACVFNLFKTVKRMMETYDAIIAGYGPTGATLANLLGSMGWRVAIVERESGIYGKPRAITADHEVLRAFQAAGLAEKIVADTCPHPGTDFVGIDGQVIKRFYPLPNPGPLGWEPSFMFYQPTLERVLREGVERFDAIDVLLEHTCLGSRQDMDGVDVDVIAPNESLKRLRGKYLLACDGARSAVRSQIGATIEDLAFDEWWIVVDADIHRDVALPQRCVQYCRPTRPGTYIVGPNRLRRWEIKVLPGEAPESFNDSEYLNDVLSTFVDTSGLVVKRVAIYRFHAVVAQQWRDSRVFLLGDAAHQMPPFMGQGLCAGVRDAYNLAWKLDAVLRGKADDVLLDTYGEERRPHVRTIVERAKEFGLIIGELDERAARDRDHRLAAELASGSVPTIRQSFVPGLVTGLLYRDTSGTPSVGAGKLFPQPWVRSSTVGRVRLDDLVRGEFWVVSTDASVAAHALSELRRFVCLAESKVVCIVANSEITARSETGPIVVEEELDLVMNWLTEHGAVAAIVRRDGFAYSAARAKDDLSRMIVSLAEALLAESPPRMVHA
ncbi:bifunctional 3-(3-hydroxy-phenyl)propionate/3-hydroxycinnamic acid hydroxylase [Burkholderia contaminans]|uniref:Bifunctional 3-(3-hydroxy-phenyl)propionate/3-hydroxycinnamic acid hydroxylase n=1 Tax=Burkholderia contaminans TaxID=488447 RepID=A0A3N8R5L1_9BURK|nr:bifunctional 3-(3-hydroxy-phenyl)propionate/3-hydroxycinnamic acid hydroxylase [Burkholderia contaminans]RQT14859.1 bifunctional 3-(3-hydroxy-phenyl)propionate/3-hydroxycinnamic acid hydroxylase [Burkholderia contaminans]